MPKATIRTFGIYNNCEVTKIISEQPCVKNIEKEVTFLEKFSKKKAILTKTVDCDLQR